jgi:hypothetical protein
LAIVLAASTLARKWLTWSMAASAWVNAAVASFSVFFVCVAAISMSLFSDPDHFPPYERSKTCIQDYGYKGQQLKPKPFSFLAGPLILLGLERTYRGFNNFNLGKQNLRYRLVAVSACIDFV